ncbi:MAG: cupin [Flavobacteriaceae bacterium]|nr:cupin [Flavobacteriaceae bacterium]
MVSVFAGLFAQVKAETIVETSTAWNGTSYRIPNDPSVLVLKIKIPAKDTLAWHQHPYFNVDYLLKGKLKVETQKGETLMMKAGESLVELNEQWHRGINVGQEDIEILVFYLKHKDVPITMPQ